MAEVSSNATNLYNGIRCATDWPPRHIHPGGYPLPVPYLAHPPRVILIDVGRQLFIDDFLVEYSTLKRVYHSAQIHDASPVLWPETELELNRGHCPVAAPFNDGAWYDPEDGLFKLWYQAGWFDGTALAVSSDGLNWQRPTYDVVSGTNAVMAHPPGYRRDGALVWRDPLAEEAARFKMFIYWRWPNHQTGHIYTSGDGIHWTDRGPTSECGDNTSFFYNPFRRKFVFSIRESWNQRARSYFEHADFQQVARWRQGEPVRWARVDRLDRPDPFLGMRPQLYDLNATAYESIMLGAFAIFHGPENPDAAHLSRPKINDLQLAYSRDGFHWHRPSRTPFIASSRQWGDWNYGYIHAAGGVCLVMEDELWFYFGAFSGQGSVLKTGETGEAYPQDNAMYAGGQTGLAILRRDGFASMEADQQGGWLATRLVTFSGKYLFVNVDNAEGALWVEAVDEQGIVVEPFSRGNCQPIATNSTRVQVVWNKARDLSELVGKPVQFRFYLRNGKLYSFWVSQTQAGPSQGYIAAGGYGLKGPTDL